MQKGHSYAADAGAEKPLPFRPSQQNKPAPTPAKTGKRPIPTSTEDVYEKNKWGHGFDDTGDTKQARDFRQMMLKKRIAAVENPAYKNPFAFTHPLDRQAATYAKVQRIIKNPSFAALPQDRKATILSNYYDKYVVPIYKDSKIEPPHKDIWVREVQKGFFKTSDFYDYSQAANRDALADVESTISHAQASAVETGSHVGHSILMAGVKVDRKILGLANFFPGSALHSWATSQADFDARLAQAPLKLSQDAIDRSTFWLDTHPTKSYTEKLGSFVGESTVQLPLYETIGAPLGALGKLVTGTGKIGTAANFTRRLATSKTGQFAGRRMAEAASAYIGDSFSETPQGDRAADMAIFMGYGIGGEVLGAAFKGLVKPIARSAMKKVVATNASIGGKVLHETIADQAEFELGHNIVGTDAAGNPIIHDPATGTKEEFAAKMKAAQDADPVKHSLVTAEKITQNAMARQLYGKPLNQLSKAQRRKVRVELVHMASEAVAEVPIHVPEVAEHEITTKLQEDTQDNPELAATFAGLEAKYGAKVVDTVAHVERESIAAEQGIISSQGATERVGRNEEVLAAKNAELGGARPSSEKTSTTQKGEPIKLKSQEELAAARPKPVQRTREQQYFSGLEDTGNLRYNSGDQGYNVKFLNPVDKALYKLTSRTPKAIAASQGLMSRLEKYFGGTKTKAEIRDMADQVKAQLDAAIKERRPRYHTGEKDIENITFPEMFKHAEPEAVKPVKAAAKVEAKAGAKTGAKVDLPKSYVSFKKDTLAHFTNPFKSRAAKQKQSLEKFLDGMDDVDFVKEISDQMGNQIRFEKPFDMLLWGLHHGDSIPGAITKKIINVLSDQDPSGTIAQWKEEGKRLSAHIDMLAMSGRLDTEGNVFRSTITSSFSGRTRWQREAEKEAALEEVENYKNSMGPYAKNFGSNYDAGLKELAKLQKLRRLSKTDADFYKAHDKIKAILEKAEGGK
jgi:hypothetical protein